MCVKGGLGRLVVYVCDQGRDIGKNVCEILCVSCSWGKGDKEKKKGAGIQVASPSFHFLSSPIPFLTIHPLTHAHSNHTPDSPSSLMYGSKQGSQPAMTPRKKTDSASLRSSTYYMYVYVCERKTG